MDALKVPVAEVFENWGKEIQPIVGKGNYSMEPSETIASGKKTYARLLLIGAPRVNGDLEGDECGIRVAFQVDSFASGSKALTKVYEIDDASHKAMVNMGFQRTYGPELQKNADNSIKRLLSRYNRLYCGEL